MAQRQTDRQRLARKVDSLDDAGIRDLLDYISIIETRSLAAGSKSLRDDEFVTVLAEARENKRARQAFEWEAARRRADRRATSLSTGP